MTLCFEVHLDVKTQWIRRMALLSFVCIRPARVSRECNFVPRKSRAAKRWQIRRKLKRCIHLHVAETPRGGCDGIVIGSSRIDNHGATLIANLLQWRSNFRTNSQADYLSLVSSP